MQPRRFSIRSCRAMSGWAGESDEETSRATSRRTDCEDAQVSEVDTAAEILEPGVQQSLIELLLLTEHQAIQWRTTRSRPHI